MIQCLVRFTLQTSFRQEKGGHVSGMARAVSGHQ